MSVRPAAEPVDDNEREPARDAADGPGVPPDAVLSSPSGSLLELAGPRCGVEPGWTEARGERWLRVFLALGVALRLVRFGLIYPLWRDEAYVAANVLERDFAGLARPLDYQQVCPLLFLWAEKALSAACGFSEWSLRLLPTLAAVASLFLFRHVAGRLLKGVAPVVAVAILAIGYTPIRHGGEIKPYATDFLAALGLIALAVEWLRGCTRRAFHVAAAVSAAPGFPYRSGRDGRRYTEGPLRPLLVHPLRTPDRTGFLWALAALGPLAVGLSNPAVFVAAGVGVVLALPVLKTRSRRALVPFVLFVLASVATFLVLLRWVNGPQSASVMSWMRVYWAGAFPPRTVARLLAWLVRTHTSQMFAYPAGGDVGASALTTALVAVAIAAYLRRGSKTVLALLLAPFALGLFAAFLGRYPYGGSARIMQYVAPSIILLAGLGAAVVLARLPGPSWRARAPRLVLSTFLAVGLGMMAWDVAHPYKERSDRSSRDFARRFWIEESAGAELQCARNDLHLPLDPLVWQNDRAALYLCYQAIYWDRSRVRPSAAQPLRVVLFNPVPADRAVMSRWIAAHAGR